MNKAHISAVRRAAALAGVAKRRELPRKPPTRTIRITVSAAAAAASKAAELGLSVTDWASAAILHA